MARKKISTTVYVERDQDLALKKLREQTGIPMAVLIREAIDILLQRMQDDDYESVIGRAEALVVKRTEEAEQEAQHLSHEVLELDILTTHARQLQTELESQKKLASYYRHGIHHLQQTTEALLRNQALTESDVFGE